MKFIYPAILAGAALIGLTAFAPPLVHKEPSVHHMTVWLPGGGTETISCTGNVPPKVTLQPSTSVFDWPNRVAFGFMPSFVAMDSLWEDVDRDMAAFLRQAETLSRIPAGSDLKNADLLTLPEGGASYSLISESTGNGTCTRMVQITRRANSEKPEIVSRTSGNCAADTAPASAPQVTARPISTPMAHEKPAPSRTAL